MAGLPAAYRAARGGCGSSIEHVPGVGFAERERPLGLLAVPLMAVLIVSQGWSTSGGVRCPAFGRTAPRRERPRLRRHGRDPAPVRGPAVVAARGGARQGRFAVLRPGRWPPLTRPPKPRAVLDTPPRWGDAGPPARDPSTRAAEQRLPRNQSPSTSPERLLTGWTDSSHLLVTAAVTRLPSKSSSAIPQRPR